MGVENKVALYIRISLEDDGIQEGKEESDSVTNQRALLRRFVSGREDLAGFGVAEFLDDGYTGRNLDRPGFQELIGQCRAGKVGCIVVKDLSRLGRNYVEVGNLLEQVFPFLGVRVISVNTGTTALCWTGRRAALTWRSRIWCTAFTAGICPIR